MLSTDVQEVKRSHPEYITAVEKNYRWNFLLLTLDSSIFSFSIAMLSQDTIIPYFASQLIDQKALIGLIPALFYLGLYFPQLIGAYLVNGRATRKWSIFAIAIAERMGILAIALTAQFVLQLTNNQALFSLLLSYLVFSITAGLISPAYADFISKNIIRKRGMFFAVTNGLGGVIGFGASFTASYLLDTFAFPINLRYLFWLGFATSFVSLFVIANFREVPFPAVTQTESLIDFLRAIPGHIKNSPRFQRFMITRGLLGLGVMGNAFYALYAIDKFDLSPGSLGTFTMVILLTQSAFGFVWGWLGDRYGFKIIYVIEGVLFVAMGLLALTATQAWSFFIIAFAIGGVYAAFATGDSNMVFEIAAPDQTSRFIGISNSFVAPVLVIAPLIGGLIVDGFSHQLLFSTVLIIGILSSIVAFLYLPNPREQLEIK